MKPPSQWTEEDLNFLISKRLGETIEREYKETIAISTPKDKKELCKDVSSFANSQGGVIVFGLKETDVANSGSIPASLSPITDLAIKETAQQIVLDGVQPRMEFRFYSIPSADGKGEYVIIEIPKSLRGLHMVTLDKENRYYIRRDYQSVPMTVIEIEEAYRQYAHKEVQAQSLIEKYRLTNPNIDLPPPQNAWLAITVVPIFPVRELFTPLCFRPGYEISSKAHGMRTKRGLLGADSFTPNYRGMAAIDASASVKSYQHQIFREGSICLGRTLGHRMGVQTLSLVEHLHNMLSLAIGLFVEGGYLGPIRFQVELSQIRLFELNTGGNEDPEDRTFPGDSFVHSVDTTVRDAVEMPVTMLEDVHHHLWQSFGYSRCDLFDPTERGVYIKRVTDTIRFIND